MANSFAALKRDRQETLTNLTSELEKTQTVQTSFEDERLWKCERDKSGNGYAVIRFLPTAEGEDVPWVRVWNHGFQGPGGWYIENSLTTLNQKDPVSEFNTALWNNGTEAGKEQARKQKRRLNYYSNIYVIKDPANPENEGQVRILRYGKKIFDKINDLMNPEFQDEDAVNPFDFWAGADFKMKIRMVEGFVNYDKSEFDTPTEFLGGNDKELETTWNAQYQLSEFTSPDNFKTYDELKTKFNRVLGLTDDPNLEFQSSKFETTTKVEEPEQIATSSDEGEDTLSYFQKLAEEQ
tara:strand:- start:52 stop:933 length:882 start_codon:yes stop_codon:yes gene_type:complete